MARHTEEQAANPLDDVGEEGRTPRRCAATPRRRPDRSRCWSRAGSRWSLLPVAIAGAYLFLHAAGPVLLLFIIAGLIALLLNPFVVLLQRPRIPRGAAVGIVMVACWRS